MGRSPCCDEANLTKGAWMPEEDKKLKDYIQDHGPGNWKILPKKAGLNRCGKSCRLRWTNYLRPDIKRGRFSEAEERLIIELHSILGNKWSAIAGRVPGRTDNEIKNYWNTHLRKKLLRMGIDPITHKPRIDLDLLTSFSKILGATTNLNSLVFPLDSDALRLQILQNLVQVITFNPAPKMVDSVSNMLYSNALQNYHDVEGFMGLPDLGFSGLNNYAYPESKNPHEQEMVPQIDNSWSISEFMMDSNGGSPMKTSYGILSAQSSPSLISASSEDFTNMVPFQESTNLRSITSLGDSEYDLGWKEILDQISIASESS